MKRSIAFLLAAAMLLCMIPTASAAGNMANFKKTTLKFHPDQFVDIRETDWFLPGVKSAYEMGLMKGITDTTFKGSGNLTVPEALAIACRIFSIYSGIKMANRITNPWYQIYVDYATENQIIKDIELDTTKQITREQFAQLMCGALPENELEAINNVTAIPDVAAGSPYADAIYRLYNAGVVTGSDKYGTFKPTTAIQRSEVATIVTRMADKSQRKLVALEAKPIPAVTEIQLAGKTQITVGESTKWTAKALPADANQKISWAAGNPGVATVDTNGNIKGIKAGQCNITATAANGIKKTVLLTVGEVAVTGIQLAGKTNVAIGGSTTWTATVQPANATMKKLTWKAGNPGVATVDQNGKITGHKAGQCNITVSAANGVKKTVMVTVVQGGTLQNPYDGSEGAVVEYRSSSDDPLCLIRVKLNKIYYGNDATSLFQYSFQEPSANQEWRVYEFETGFVDCKPALSARMDYQTFEKITVPASPSFTYEPALAIGVTDRYFTSDGASAPIYSYEGVSPYYYPIKLFKGASSKFMFGILVDKNIGTLMLGVPRVIDGTVMDEITTFILLNNPAPAASTSSTAQSTSQNTQSSAFDVMVAYAKSHSGVFASEEDTEADGMSKAKITSQYSIRYDATKDEIVLSGTTDAKRKQPRSFTYEMTIPRKHNGTFSGKVKATETNDSDSSKTVIATGTIKIKASGFPFDNGYGYDVKYNSYSGDSVKAQLAALSNEITATSMVTMAQWYYHDMLNSLNDTILKPAGHNVNEFGFKYYN